jgi:hypothetical protein
MAGSSFLRRAVCGAVRRHRADDIVRTTRPTSQYMVVATRAARRRVGRHRVWNWLAPLVVARKRARYRARLLADGRA